MAGTTGVSSFLIPHRMVSSVDRTPTHNTHLCSTQSVHKRGTHRTRLAQELHNIFVRLKRICHLVCTCLTLCCSLTCRLPRAHHLPHSLLLLTTTQEHAAQSGQQDHLQEHPVHHEHLQALPVDMQRHQESLWRENLHRVENPHKTTPTSYEPKELATVSRIEDYPGDPYQLYDAQEKSWRRRSPSPDHRISEGTWRI